MPSCVPLVPLTPPKPAVTVPRPSSTAPGGCDRTSGPTRALSTHPELASASGRLSSTRLSMTAERSMISARGHAEVPKRTFPTILPLWAGRIGAEIRPEVPVADASTTCRELYTQIEAATLERGLDAQQIQLSATRYRERRDGRDCVTADAYASTAAEMD